ncbi:MAG: hypothetical protein IKF17_03575 [Clostridia bacterium]|nr:hypothetical protein [Clostridia bacterium]
MNNLIRYYNQNKKKIWRYIIIIAFAFALLQLANGIAKSNNQRRIEQAKMQSINSLNSQQKSSVQTQNSATDEQKQTTKQNSKVVTIEQFIALCNKKELENAYNMLTDKCKEEMFASIEDFSNIYYASTFENKEKEADIEKWDNNTYMVKFTENALATGKIAKTKEEQKIDYITVVEENDEYRLNINSYIGYEELSKTKKDNDVIVDVIEKNSYMNFEIYTLKITNNSDSKIMLDTLANNSFYIEDSKGVKYRPYINELTQEMVTIDKGHSRQIDIKFYSSYISTKRIRKLVFEDFKTENTRKEFVIDL